MTNTRENFIIHTHTNGERKTKIFTAAEIIALFFIKTLIKALYGAILGNSGLLYNKTLSVNKKEM